MVESERFRERYGPWAVVTGAAQGIGHAFAEALAARHLDLLMIDSQAEALARAAQHMRDRHRVCAEILEIDLAAPDLAPRLEPHLHDKDVGLLVCNAAHSEVGGFLASSLESKLRTLDVNCRAPLMLTSLLSRRLVARGRGGILLMSSLSGFQGSAFVGTYAASKAFNTVLGESLWAELLHHGVDVLVCAAGATSTPTFDRQTPVDKRKLVFPMLPEEVVRSALAHLKDGPVHIPGALNRLVATCGRLLGRRRAVELVSKTTRKMFG